MESEITFDRFMEQAKAQGVPLEHIAFRCCMCGTVQSIASLMEAGGLSRQRADRFIGFSCIGWLNGSGPPPGVGNGCNWTLGGLLKNAGREILHIKQSDGSVRDCFPLATPDEARALMAKYERGEARKAGAR